MKVESLRIIALGLATAIGYGIVHDQVSVRIAPEFLILAHPRIVNTDSPTLIALVWGIVATWWVGLPLGCLLAAAARAGSRPKVEARRLVRPALLLFIAMAVTSVVAGLAGHALGKEGVIFILEPLASEIPEERHALFLGAFVSHLAAYAAGIIGGLGLCWRVYRRRGRLTETGPARGRAASPA
jgi:hypothetical protein